MQKQLLNFSVIAPNFLFLFQRTGPSDLYSKPPRNPLIGAGLEELDDFSDDDTSPLTEPIYNGR